MQKATAFLYTNNEQMAFETKNTQHHLHIRGKINELLQFKYNTYMRKTIKSVERYERSKLRETYSMFVYRKTQ